MSSAPPVGCGWRNIGEMGDLRLVLIGLACAGCEVVELGAAQQPIINGTPDVARDAVVAVFDTSTSSQCTGIGRTTTSRCRILSFRSLSPI